MKGHEFVLVAERNWVWQCAKCRLLWPFGSGCLSTNWEQYSPANPSAVDNDMPTCMEEMMRKALR